MAFDSKKTILLEKTYLYVRASLGFQLEGTSTEKIPTNNGFYRFFVDNLQKAIGNSYVNILYDSQDLTLQCFCSELYMDELMSSDSSAIEDVVEELKKNTTTIVEFENGVSSALQSNHQDNVALNAKLEGFEAGVSSALAANHEDNVLLHTDLNSLSLKFLDFQNYKKLPSYVNLNVNSSSNNLYIPFDFSNFRFNEKNKSYIGYFFLDINYPFSRKQEINCILDFLPFRVNFGTGGNFDYSYCFSYLDAEGTLKYWSGSYYTSSSWFRATTSFNSGYTLLGFSVCVSLTKWHYDYLSTFLGKKGNSSFFNNNLVLNSDNLNLSFDYPFTGGYLDFRFYSSLSLPPLNNFTYTFITDMGRKSFLGSDLNIVHDSNDSNLCLCTNLPNLDFSGSPKACSRLLGLSVSV